MRPMRRGRLLVGVVALALSLAGDVFLIRKGPFEDAKKERVYFKAP